MSTRAEVTAGVCVHPLTGSGWVFVIWQTRAFPPEWGFTEGRGVSVVVAALNRVQITCAADRRLITLLFLAISACENKLSTLGICFFFRIFKIPILFFRMLGPLAIT